jgi:hypothetical protein
MQLVPVHNSILGRVQERVILGALLKTQRMELLTLSGPMELTKAAASSLVSLFSNPESSLVASPSALSFLGGIVTSRIGGR